MRASSSFGGPIDTSNTPPGDASAERDRMVATAALFGCAFVVVVDAIMWTRVDGYSPVAQTISELAAGPHHRLQDYAIVVFALGILALGATLFLKEADGAATWIVRVASVALAVDVVLIAVWNEYGDGQPGGPTIHLWLCAILYALVPLLLWFTPRALPPFEGPLTAFGRSMAVAWTLGAPVFYLVPTSVDGAYERVLALVMIGAVALAAWRLRRTPDPACCRD